MDTFTSVCNQGIPWCNQPQPAPSMSTNPDKKGKRRLALWDAGILMHQAQSKRKRITTCGHRRTFPMLALALSVRVVPIRQSVVQAFGTVGRIRHGHLGSFAVGRGFRLSQHFSTKQSLAQQQSTSSPSEGSDDNSADIEHLTNTWREHPSCKRTVIFRSWRILDGAGIQSLMNNKITQQYLARTCEVVSHLKKPLRAVRDSNQLGIDDAGENFKVILLHPDAPRLVELPAEARDVVQPLATDGPDVPITFPHTLFKASYLLASLLPIPFPNSFETIGHVAHYNLKADHLPYRFLIGQVLLESLPSIETAIHKVGEVSGPHRTYNYELLAGRDDLHVNVTESGVSLQFNLSEVYWCSRLSEERLRLLHEEILPGKRSKRPVILADVFCGVGALCLQAAANSNVTVWANDWNPHAVRYLRANAKRNGLSVVTQCGDAYDYLIDLGVEQERLPDHVVLNFPLEAPRFLGALRWWPKNGTISPRIHVYTFIGRDGVNPVPEALLEGRTMEELNEDYGCEVVTHEVRDVAPGKSVACVSFTATNKLLRHMQGDFT